MENLIQTIVISALPIVLAITLHEAAHGYAALHLGDDTAARAGRISLNPFRHIDWWGTVLLPLLLIMLSGGKFIFGYAKPVPVNFGRLFDPKRDMFWVALAGPLSNLIQAVVWAILLKLTWIFPASDYTMPMATMSQVGITANLVLMVLNLLPLPPLDGGRILVSLLPMSLARVVARLERYGFVILLALLFTGILGAVLTPLVDTAEQVLNAIFGLY
jgi:Zn-dependent protease